MTTIFCKSDGAALIPQSKAALIALFNLPRDVSLKVVVTRPRNTKFHRLAWALFTYVAEALNNGPAGSHWTPESVKDDLLVATGFCKSRPMSAPERRRHNVSPNQVAIVSIPESISFGSMDESKFGQFMAASMLFIATDLCPWIEGSPHWADIQEILRASYMEAA